MKLSIVLATLGATALLSGCGSAVVASLDGSAVPQQQNIKSHMVSGTADGNGSVSVVSDRTANGVDTTATLFIAKVPFSDAQVPTSAEVSFAGKTDGGATIQNSGRMQAPASLADKAIAGETINTADIRYSDADSFLQMVDAGNGWGAARYEARQGNTAFLGYVVAGQRTEGSAMPSAGAATYNGKANATWFASSSGKGTATGNSTVIATFAPGGGTVKGTITGIAVDGVAQPGLALNLNPTAIAGNSYAGGATMTGALSSTGNYQGGFYSTGATGTAGTFHMTATGVATSAGIQNVEAVGAFGGNQ
jgi:hypothetical protein